MLKTKLFLTTTMNRLAHLLGRVAVTSLIMVSITQMASAVPSKLKRECRSDYKTLCPLYKVGTSKMRSCMRSNGRQLSWSCYQALKDYGYVKSRKGS
jgi:hypothetical protein